MQTAALLFDITKKDTLKSSNMGWGPP